MAPGAVFSCTKFMLSMEAVLMTMHCFTCLMHGFDFDTREPIRRDKPRPHSSSRPRREENLLGIRRSGGFAALIVYYRSVATGAESKDDTSSKGR